MNAEIKVLIVEKAEWRNVLPSKLGVGQNIALHASPTARNFSLVLFSTFMVHSPLDFSPIVTLLFNCVGIQLLTKHIQ